MLYLGNLDDAVRRYPWTGRRNALGFNKTLLENLLFGEPGYVNDGYIVQSEQALEGIRREGTTSLIETLVEHEYIKVLCRTDPVDMIDAMVEGGVTTHASLVNDTQVRRDLKQWSNTLKNSNAYQKWPNVDIGQGFYKLVKLVKYAPKHCFWFEALHIQTFRKIANEFIIQFEHHPKAARTKWENISIEFCSKYKDRDKRDLAILESMNFANEVYHFNFSGILSSDFSTSVSTESRLNPLFFWMLDQDEMESSPSLEDDHPPVTLPIPAMPWESMPLDLHNGILVAKPFLTESSIEYQSRSHFIESREKLFDDIHNEDLQAEFREASTRYNRVLSVHFGVAHSDAEIVFERFANPVAKVMDDIQANKVADWAGEALEGLPADGVSVALKGLIQSAPFVAAAVGYGSPTIKKKLRRIGRLHNEEFLFDNIDEFTRQTKKTAKKSKDIIISSRTSKERCKLFFSDLESTF